LGVGVSWLRATNNTSVVVLLGAGRLDAVLVLYKGLTLQAQVATLFNPGGALLSVGIGLGWSTS
jgi:hypothetical protein